jgi:hypothetical protein
MRTPPVIVDQAELEPQNGGAVQIRILVRAGNSIALPGSFDMVDLASGRGEDCGPRVTEIRARRGERYGRRIVTVRSRWQTDELVQVRVRPRKRGTPYRIVAVYGRRVRDVRSFEGFNAEAWKRRYGRAMYDSNPWVWALTLARESAP